MSRLRAATLAVGTEVCDGQITDRNSAWLSDKCVSAGLDVFEHRVVPDDRALIARALRDLSSQADVLFVTGGLGPTSDDFTRDLLAEVFNAPLEYDDGSWQKIVKRFEARGAVAKPIQKQQCYFPRGAQILENPVGTANAFAMKVGRTLIAVLPGPPAEIAAVWDAHLEMMIPRGEREELHLWQTLGLGEGDIAEKVEAAIAGAGVRVGYRVHLPYVEVKLWADHSSPAVAKVDEALREWTVAKGKDDLADGVIRAAFSGSRIAVVDQVTGGYLQTRLAERLAAFRKSQTAPFKGALQVTTALVGEATAGEADLVLTMLGDASGKQWQLKISGEKSQTLAVAPTSLYNFGTERGQKYAAEKMLHLLSQVAPFDQKV